MAEGADKMNWMVELLVQHEGSAKKIIWNKDSDLLGILSEKNLWFAS